jgi:hypothetical protein
MDWITYSGLECNYLSWHDMEERFDLFLKMMGNWLTLQTHESHILAILGNFTTYNSKSTNYVDFSECVCYMGNEQQICIYTV